MKIVHRLRCYGNITRTLVTSLRPSRDMTTQCERPSGRCLRAQLAGDWRVPGRSQNCAACMGSARGWLAGDWPSTGAFSALLRWPGLRASTGGVLATQRERKMLASTCLYSLYAQLFTCSLLRTRMFTNNNNNFVNLTTRQHRPSFIHSLFCLISVHFVCFVLCVLYFTCILLVLYFVFVCILEQCAHVTLK